MKKELFFEAKTIEDALKNAATELSLDPDFIDYEVSQTPSKGIFGIGATNAKIKVIIEVKEEKPKQKFNLEPEKISKKKEKKPVKKVDDEIIAPKKETKPVNDEITSACVKFLSQTLKDMGIENFEFVCSITDDGVYEIEIKGDKMGVVIGRRGETLDSLQYLLNLAVNRSKEEKVRINLDTENYRQKRILSLEKLASRTADKAVKYKKNMSLEPMSAYERRIIHASLSGRENIQTYSVGKEPRRKVVISFDAKK